jgi:hypothetical protein
MHYQVFSTANIYTFIPFLYSFFILFVSNQQILVVWVRHDLIGKMYE